MNFLCPNHRQQFTDLPMDERQDLWQFWMENAHSLCESGQWRDVICLAGSAFDLACLESTEPDQDMLVEMTLSAILVSRVLSDLGQRNDAERVVFRALERLQPEDEQLPAFSLQCVIGECMEVLLSTARQAEFFLDHLNWPSLPFMRSRTYRVQVVH